MNIANWLSASRLVLLPLAVMPLALGWNEGWLLAAAVNALAGASDYADGYLARRLNQSTARGASLDFMSDKIYICGLLITLWAQGSIAAWIPLVVIGREMLILLLRLKSRGSPSLASDFWGKTKTFVSFLAIGWVALNESLHSGSVLSRLNLSGLEHLFSLAPWAVFAAVVLTLLSGLNYLWKYSRPGLTT